MRIVCQTFSLPKAGREFADYEDAYYPCNPDQLSSYVEEKSDAQTFRTTVCDGATDSCFSKEWAELLAAGYGRGEWSEDVSEKALVPAQKTWQEFLATQELPWFAEEKVKLGAFAAMAGLTVEQGGTWKAVAIGDCCLFQTRQGQLVEAFPIKTSAEFSNFPFLIGSLPERNGGVFQHKMTKPDGRWEAGDIFFLMSDAIACWFLKAMEGGAAAEAIDWLSRLNNHEAFRELVNAERKQLGGDGLASMRDDDVTFVKIVIDGRAVDLTGAGSQASAAPRVKAGPAKAAAQPGPGSGGSSSGSTNAETKPLVSSKPATADLAKPQINNSAATAGASAEAAGGGASSASGTPRTPGSGGAASASAPPASRTDPPKPAQKSVAPVAAPVPSPPAPPPPAAPTAAKLPLNSAKPAAAKPNKMIIGGIAAALIAAGGIMAMMTLGPAGKRDKPAVDQPGQPAAPGKNPGNAGAGKKGNSQKSAGGSQKGNNVKNGAGDNSDSNADKQHTGATSNKRASKDSASKPTSRDFMPETAPDLGAGDVPMTVDQDQDDPAVAPDRNQNGSSMPPDSVQGGAYPSTTRGASRPVRKRKSAVTHSQDTMPPTAPPFKKNDQSYMP